ncbi:MAG: thermonuclease family protein, partial [Acidimicrobiia bacterium]|nr:thermonuclease family protein [Acidimicrobiia bacterium]
LAVVLLVGVACGGPPAAGGAPGTGVVTAVIDGDTVDVEVGGGAVERVRLIGIDTPESVDRDRPVECHGPEASALLAALLPAGTTVRLERDAEARDRYGRLLAYVFRDDGLFVNEAIAAAGEAEILEIPPNTAYGPQLRAAVGVARTERVGLWGECRAPP